MLHASTWMDFALLLACASAAHADIWHNGDLTTYTQDNWGGHPNMDAGAALLVASYDTVYAGTFGLATVGSISRFDRPNTLGFRS